MAYKDISVNNIKFNNIAACFNNHIYTYVRIPYVHI